MRIPIFYTCPHLWFFNRTRMRRSLHVWRLSLTSVIPFWGEDYDHGWLSGFDAGRASYIHTHWVTASLLMLLVLFLIYSIIEQEQNQSFVLLSAQHALCFLCLSSEFWLGSGMILSGVVAIPALALSSLWCHSYFAERSQLAMSQLLRHPLHSKVCLGEPKLMQSYPQETILKTDGLIRWKNKTRREERRTRKRI